jgi:hypothetical protein
MARSHEPPSGSDHPHQNGIKRRRVAIALFIMATFGIAAVLSFPLVRNVELPFRLPRASQGALNPSERLIRPIVPSPGARSPAHPSKEKPAPATRPSTSSRSAPPRTVTPIQQPPQPAPPPQPPPPPPPPPQPPPPSPEPPGHTTRPTNRGPRSGSGTASGLPAAIFPGTSGSAPSGPAERPNVSTRRHHPNERGEGAAGGRSGERSSERPAKHRKVGKHAKQESRPTAKRHERRVKPHERGAKHGKHHNRAGKR